MDKDKVKCFLCNNVETENNTPPGADFYYYECPNCGKYYADRYWTSKVTLEHDQEFKKLGVPCYDAIFMASCVAAEKKLKGQDDYFLSLHDGMVGRKQTIRITDFIKEFPETPTDRFNRSILNLGRFYPSKPFVPLTAHRINKNVFFASSEFEKEQTLRLLKEEKLIYVQETHNDAYLTPRQFSISPKGWSKIAELKEHYKEHSGKAFLAMWFNDTTALFSEAAKQGAKGAGYNLLVVTDEHHNDFIMNKVLNMIDESKFVIADFTCMPETTAGDNIKNGVRGGVYYEAGFANGQGKEVVMTCRDNQESWKRRHFDIEQKNTIFWKEKDGKIVTSKGDFDFADYLKERIIRSVGKGPNYEQENFELVT